MHQSSARRKEEAKEDLRNRDFETDYRETTEKFGHRMIESFIGYKN